MENEFDEIQDIRTPEDFQILLEQLNPSESAHTLLRDRPYNGQPHTDTGERGRQEVHGVTMRDLRDCYIRACYHASGLSPSQYPKSPYDLPWNEMDQLAVFQNMMCEVEKLMGIYPNVPKLTDVWDYTPMLEMESIDETAEKED